ncbi:unnamed protein product [Paramecium primaurelia]|uniref:BTB domain-containing protein n=1 Tax=Paramecium primaurelia TaxID=5886 RepID=A0A8S1M5J3_PARPR|nr:unnamed protein product [Paramecium primaurelia]
MDYCIRKTEMTDNKEDDVTFASYEWENIKATTASQLPTCRNCHTATTFKHYMIIFGGKEGEGRKKFCNDIHILDLKRLNWTSQIKVSGQIPDVRMGHSAQNYYDKIIYYGGWNGYTVLDDIIMMTPSEQMNVVCIDWQYVKSENTPPKRQFHTANICGDVMYIFGGGDGKMWLSDLYKFDLVKCYWAQVDTTGQKPQGRLQHSSVIYDHKIYVFGGEPDRSHQLNDLYQLDIGNNVWTRLQPKGSTPSPRVSASAVMMNNKIYLFGGYDGQQWRNDVFMYNIIENQWEYIVINDQEVLPQFRGQTKENNISSQQSSPPRPRCRHSAIAYKNTIVIFGGNDSEKSYNDVYMLKQQSTIKLAESTLKQDFSSILFSPILSDITFFVDNQEIHAHKIILASRCEYFKTLFLNEQFNLGDKLVITETTINVFKAILQYIYTDEVLIDSYIVYDLLALADKYMLQRLKNLCEDHLIKNISLKNVIEVVNLADKFSAQELKANAMIFLLDNKQKILNTQDINMLSKEILIELLKFTK